MIRESIIFGAFRWTTYASVAILGVTIVLLALSGWGVVDWQFLTSPWKHRDIMTGGILQAIVGSIFLGIGVTLTSYPLGLGTAIFLNEYSEETWYRRLVQLTVRNLAGVPSVVYGLFGLALFVHALSFGTSILAASLTLAIMTLPWIITAALEALQSVPMKFRDSSLALGATKWQTVRHVVLPVAVPGSLTGGIIGIARALGETAPIILVGATFYLSGYPSSAMDKFMALPYHTFILATQHASSHATAYASGTALVLIVLTFTLSIGAILLRYRLRRQKDW